MAKKGDGPKTGKIPIDYVSLDYFQGSYKYTVRFATQSTDSQSLTIVTYLIGADGTHSPALSYYKSKSKAQDAIVDTGVTNRLWAGLFGGLFLHRPQMFQAPDAVKVLVQKTALRIIGLEVADQPDKFSVEL